MRSAALALALSALPLAYACSPSAPPVVAPPAASASASASACDPKPTPPIADADPRIVRCGIDDRPRSIVTELDVPRDRRAKMEAAPFGFGRGGPGFVPPGPGIGGQPRAGVSLGKPALASGGAAPADLEKAVRKADLDFDACDHLAQPGDEGTYEVELSFASSGSPTTVRAPKVKAPTPFVRCVMERVCGVREAPPTPAEVAVPLAVKWNYARMKGPVEKAPPASVVPILLMENPKGDTHGPAFFRTARVLIRGALRQCIGQGPDLRVELKLSEKSPPTVEAADVAALGPGLDKSQLDCVADRLKKEKLPDPPDGLFSTTAGRSVAFQVEFAVPPPGEGGE